MCDPKLSKPLIFNSISEFLIGQEPGNPHFSQSCHDKANYIRIPSWTTDMIPAPVRSRYCLQFLGWGGWGSYIYRTCAHWSMLHNYKPAHRVRAVGYTGCSGGGHHQAGETFNNLGNRVKWSYKEEKSKDEQTFSVVCACAVKGKIPSIFCLINVGIPFSQQRNIQNSLEFTTVPLVPTHPKQSSK